MSEKQTSDYRSGHRFLMWYADIVRKYNLSKTDALMLFLAERNGRESVLSARCLEHVLKIKRRNIPDYIRRLKKAGVIDGAKGFNRNKRRLYRFCINRTVYDEMQEMYKNKTHCIRIDAVFHPTRFKMSFSDLLVVCCIKGLQQIPGFRIGRGTIRAYTTLDKTRIGRTVNNPKIRKLLNVKKVFVPGHTAAEYYSFKKWKEDAVFTTPYRLVDKLFIISQELVKYGLATEPIIQFVNDRNCDRSNCRSIGKALTAGNIIMGDSMMRVSVKRLFGQDLERLTKPDILLFDGRRVYKTKPKKKKHEMDKVNY